MRLLWSSISDDVKEDDVVSSQRHRTGRLPYVSHLLALLSFGFFQHECGAVHAEVEAGAVRGKELVALEALPEDPVVGGTVDVVLDGEVETLCGVGPVGCVVR